MDKKINKLGKWLKESKHTVVLTGAGMSTESGLPDFRSEDGLWEKIDPMEHASISSLTENYDRFHESYRDGLGSMQGSKPHKGYYILAKWEKDGLVNAVITQNVDDLHLKAGNENVYRVHGSINEFRCMECGNPVEQKDFMDKIPCDKCGGRLRPNVILFGEGLPEKELYGSMDEIAKADLVIVIGSSLVVFPVSQLPDLTKGKKVYINRDIPMLSKFDLKLEGSAGEILEKIDNIL